VSPTLAADGRVYALKQVKLKGMKRVDREEAIDEVHTATAAATAPQLHVACHPARRIPVLLMISQLDSKLL
jgi:hypothetical protein